MVKGDALAGRVRTVIGAVLVFGALPAAAQDYYGTTAAARHGNGYTPASIVAGWERETSFTVIVIAPDGQRVGNAGVATDWKATMITGPRAAPEEDNEEDERYQDKLQTNPTRAVPAGPPVERRETVYFSNACPAVLARTMALKPLTGFEFDPPAFKGNQDGANGDGREGFDLWLRVGDAELNKSAETQDSALGRWFRDSVAALEACPGKP
jgi:hypothetical protein